MRNHYLSLMDKYAMAVLVQELRAQLGDTLTTCPSLVQVGAISEALQAITEDQSRLLVEYRPHAVPFMRYDPVGDVALHYGADELTDLVTNDGVGELIHYFIGDLFIDSVLRMASLLQDESPYTVADLILKGYSKPTEM